MTSQWLDYYNGQIWWPPNVLCAANGVALVAKLPLFVLHTYSPPYAFRMIFSLQPTPCPVGLHDWFVSINPLIIWCRNANITKTNNIYVWPSVNALINRFTLTWYDTSAHSCLFANERLVFLRDICQSQTTIRYNRWIISAQSTVFTYLLLFICSMYPSCCCFSLMW